jgi:Amt family ammonium transporter
MTGVIYPFIVAWIWGGGWLNKMGFHDYAGSCVVHLTGGISGLIGTIVIGPRHGKFY